MISYSAYGQLYLIQFQQKYYFTVYTQKLSNWTFQNVTVKSTGINPYPANVENIVSS